MGGNPEGELTQVVEITKLRILSGLIKLMIGWGGGVVTGEQAGAL